MQTAQALVAPAQGSPLELREVILEAPRPDEALVEIHATGVCHGDIACMTGKVPVPFPIVLGHEGTSNPKMRCLGQANPRSHSSPRPQAVALSGKSAVTSKEYSQAMQSLLVSTPVEHAVSALKILQLTAGNSLSSTLAGPGRIRVSP